MDLTERGSYAMYDWAVPAMTERPRRTGAAVLLSVLLLASCATGERALDDPAGWAPGGQRFTAHRVEHLRVKVLESLPHDPQASGQEAHGPLGAPRALVR